MRFTLEQKMRTGHVKRWQIVRVAREQTIAEHMYRVYHIAVELAGMMNLSPARMLNVQNWALLHDLPEVVTGDIATPTKRAMRQAVPDQDPVRHIELSLDRGYRDLYLGLKESDPVVLDIVKLADLLEAVNFLMVEGIGKHAEEVEMGLRVAFLEKLSECREKYPDLDWEKAPEVYGVVGMHAHEQTPAPAYPVTT